MTCRSCHYSGFWLCTHAALGATQDPVIVAASAIMYVMTTCGWSKKSQSELVADNDERPFPRRAGRRGQRPGCCCRGSAA